MSYPIENRYEKKYQNLVPPKRRTGWNRILVELDGCQIRTGILLSPETEELTPLRRLRKRKRQIDWWDDFWQTYSYSAKP